MEENFTLLPTAKTSTPIIIRKKGQTTLAIPKTTAKALTMPASIMRLINREKDVKYKYIQQ